MSMRPILKDYIGMIAIAALFLIGFGAIAIFLDRENEPETASAIQATPFLQGEPNLLVDVPWLVANQNTVDLVIDLSDRDRYDQGHIPGAAHVWWQDPMPWHAPNYGQGGALSEPSSAWLTLEYPLDTRIVVYDNESSERSSWFLWLLRTSGYEQSWVLDGGFAAWIGTGQPGSTEPAPLASVALPEPTWIEANVIGTEELAGRLDDPDLVIIDTRTPEQQQDTVNETVRAGQVPGSWSVPAPSVMRDDGTFRPADQLREVFAPIGVTPESEIVVYGRFGTETGRVWLALRHAGFENVRVYDEGWVHWGWNTALPIEPVGTIPQRPTPVATPDATPIATPVATPEASPAQ
jgi:thiosulfate/3-mercaptopyruvate sulfurtransferase